ncbi:UNVERIFIED_CONTAM: hypothetical protein K2H54_073985 [Gekko kuhli]
MQNREEERPSVLEVELFQHPFVTVTSNKPVPEESTAEFTVQVKIEIEESEIALQLPANKQASYRSSASSEEKKLTQNICLLEFVSGEMKPVSVAETSTDTLVEQTVTVEANRVEIEKSKEKLSDPSKENPEKLQNESFLLEEDVEAKESKVQKALLKEDIALQKERKEIDAVVTERNVDPKKDNDFANECQLCQFDTETVTMIEQLVDQRPRKAQLVKHFPDSGNSENKQRHVLVLGNKEIWIDPKSCSQIGKNSFLNPLSKSTLSASSKGKSPKATVVNENAIKKISALEEELSHLRAQIALIVSLHGARNYQSCSGTVNSSDTPWSAFPQSSMTSTPVPISACSTVIPPPPPLPEVPPSESGPHISTTELIKQRRAASKNKDIASRTGCQEAKAVPSMADILKDINKVKLRAVERSPGGTPVPRTKKIIRVQWDPAALIAEALKEKFAARSNDDDSFDKENRSSDASPFSSPETPIVRI